MDVIQLAGELELDSEGEEESDSESEDEGEECIDEELAEGEFVLLAVELVKEHQISRKLSKPSMSTVRGRAFHSM